MEAVGSGSYSAKEWTCSPASSVAPARLLETLPLDLEVARALEKLSLAGAANAGPDVAATSPIDQSATTRRAPDRDPQRVPEPLACTCIDSPSNVLHVSLTGPGYVLDRTPRTRPNVPTQAASV